MSPNEIKKTSDSTGGLEPIFNQGSDKTGDAPLAKTATSPIPHTFDSEMNTIQNYLEKIPAGKRINISL